MKAVILAAGKGTRMAPLTDVTPKPLLSIAGGASALERKIRILPADIDEIILVVWHLADKIVEKFGSEWEGRKISYVYAEPNGTGYALWKCADLLRGSGSFLLMVGDDLYVKSDIEKMLQYPYAILVYKSEGQISGGRIELDADGMIADIIEGTHQNGASVWAGVYVLSPRIFDLPLVPKAPGSSEFGLPQTLLQLPKGTIKAVFATEWHQITEPADLDVPAERLALFS